MSEADYKRSELVGHDALMMPILYERPELLWWCVCRCTIRGWCNWPADVVTFTSRVRLLEQSVLMSDISIISKS